VTPVEESREARVECVDRTEEVRGVDVVRRHHRRRGGHGLPEELPQRRVAARAAEHRLPGVPVPVDESRHDDHAAGIDHLGAVVGQAGADG
jgi:hypothetical protein